MLSTFSLLTLLPLASAHFLLTYPAARGFDDDKAGTFPCGGFDTVSSSRVSWPTVGAPIQLDMHHTQTNVMVILALGDGTNPSYNITMRPTFSEEGLGDFCMGMVSVPSDVNITEGQLATIQVVSNGDPDGGLYQCADVILTKTALSTTDYNNNCKNNTGVKVTGQVNHLANVTGEAASTSSASGTAAATAASASSSATSSGMAAQATMAGGAMLLGGLAVVGAMAGL